MKLSLDRNNLIDKKDNPENYIFFAVRNAKAEQIVFYIKNYFAKRQLFVEVDIDYKCIKIDLFKDKEKENFLVRSYVWLKDIEKETSFNNSFSNFMFDVIGINTMERYTEIGSKDVTPPHSKFKNNGYMYCFFFFAITLFFITCYLNKTYFVMNEYEFYDNVVNEFFRNIVLYYTLGFSIVCFIMYLIYDEINENIDKKLKQNNKSKNIS